MRRATDHHQGDAEYRDPDISIFLDGRAYHAQHADKIKDDLHRRNRLERQRVCVLEFTYGDVMDHFDEVLRTIRSAFDGANGDVDMSALPGITIVHRDDQTKQADVEISTSAWLSDETARVESLRSANASRVRGWRLQRPIAGDAS